MDLDIFHKIGIHDVHTHNPNAPVTAVYNILPQDFLNFKFQRDYFYSAGIHPWYIENSELQLAQLEEILERQSNILLIGECGLDKLKGPNLSIQMDVFREHLSLAKHFQKPLIIHCVKAHQEVLVLMRQMQFNQSFIFHGFNKSLALALQIIKAGGSISLNFNMPEAKKAIYLKALPKERVFFESDMEVYYESLL